MSVTLILLESSFINISSPLLVYYNFVHKLLYKQVNSDSKLSEMNLLTGINKWNCEKKNNTD